jgi:hypothetical protein
MDGRSRDAVLSTRIGAKVRAEFQRAGIVIAEFAPDYDDGGPVPSYEEETPFVAPPRIGKLIDRRRAIADRRGSFMTAVLGALHSSAAVQDQKGYILQEPVHSGNWLVVRNCSGRLGVQTDDHEGKKPRSRPLSDLAARRAVALVESSLKFFEGEGWQLLTLLYVASYQYQVHQFASSTINSWAIIEAIQNSFWEQLLGRLDSREGGHTLINKERRDSLTGRDYTASIISQTLSLCREYPDEWLDALNKIRKARNAFVHELKDPGIEGAGDALSMASVMLSRLLGEDVSFPIAYGTIDPNEALNF